MAYLNDLPRQSSSSVDHAPTNKAPDLGSLLKLRQRLAKDFVDPRIAILFLVLQPKNRTHRTIVTAPRLGAEGY